MKWLTDLFGNKPSKPRRGPADPAADAYKSKATPPAAIDEQSLPPEILKQFVPLRDLDAERLAALRHRVKHYGRGASIFVLREPAQEVVYLLEGEIEMRPDGECSYLASRESPWINLPLNSGESFGATAIARTPVKILCVSDELRRLWVAKSRQNTGLPEPTDLELPERLRRDRFFEQFIRAYRENHLSLPSLPEVAMKLKDAINRNVGVAEAAKIIQVDVSIVSKLIQIANSPMYAAGTPITNCLDAVIRLGLAATRNLVVGMSMKQLFKSDNPRLMTAMKKLWRDSLYVSSLSFVIAEECTGINPEDALLAGLMCDVGVIPLYQFAAETGSALEPGRIEEAIPYVRGPVGCLVLRNLGIAGQLAEIPEHAEDWYYDGGGALTLTDIVILAKLHSLLGTRQAGELPHINTIPAYSKLPAGRLTPDLSLEILQKGKSRIASAIKILS
jgi:HD-like signal output (HDOD) protein